MDAIFAVPGVTPNFKRSVNRFNAPSTDYPRKIAWLR